MYRLRPRAEADLEEIWLYTLRNWSVEQADRYHNQIIDSIEKLASGQASGRSTGIRDLLRYPSGSHVIYHRTEGRAIDVIRILHNRMDPDRHLS